MNWSYEGITCDDMGAPRGKRSHRIVCDEDGCHVWPGTCITLLGHGSMTISVEEAGPGYGPVPPCKVCHLGAQGAT